MWKGGEKVIRRWGGGPSVEYAVVVDDNGKERKGTTNTSILMEIPALRGRIKG